MCEYMQTFGHAKNVIACVEICAVCENICGLLGMQHMQHDFHICNFKNAIICGKICDMRVLESVHAVSYYCNHYQIQPSE